MNQLKEAEKKATQLVQDARKARVEKLKEAKLEAEIVVATYKAEREAEYQAQLAKATGKSGAIGNELQSTTNSEIDTMTRDFNIKKENVEKMLMDLVLKVNVTPPPART